MRPNSDESERAISVSKMGDRKMNLKDSKGKTVMQKGISKEEAKEILALMGGDKNIVPTKFSIDQATKTKGEFVSVRQSTFLRELENCGMIVSIKGRRHGQRSEILDTNYCRSAKAS